MTLFVLQVIVLLFESHIADQCGRVCTFSICNALLFTGLFITLQAYILERLILKSKPPVACFFVTVYKVYRHVIPLLIIVSV